MVCRPEDEVSKWKTKELSSVQLPTIAFGHIACEICIFNTFYFFNAIHMSVLQAVWWISTPREENE